MKCDPAGNVLWAKSAGGTSNDQGYGIVVDGSGNSYLTGYFEDSSSFGSTIMINEGAYDVYVAKLDDLPNSIAEVAETQGWKVHPNPVLDILYLTSINNKTRPCHINIYGCTGRKVLEKIIDGKEAEINMQHLTAGLYWIKIEAEGVKVVKE